MDSGTGGYRGPFSLGSFSTDEYRPIKVIVIGAGYSGIIAGIRFAQKVSNLDLTIYEKNNGIGGTWFSNRYPGAACDIPSHSYQLTFAEKRDWSAFYAPGPEIRDYLQGVVDKYKLMKYIKLNHELVHAQYDELGGKWILRIRNSDGQEIEDKADIVVSATGVLSRWRWPDIPGMNDFEGRLVHSANWDINEGPWEDGVKDWHTKRIAVIGAGSSGIQIVAALQPKVAHLTNFVRNKTWLVGVFEPVVLASLTKSDDENYTFTDEDKRAFEDLEYYKNFRHNLEASMNSNFRFGWRGTPLVEEATKMTKERMSKKLAKKPWIAEQLIPAEFSVGCKRATPGPGYLEALCEDNVDFVSSGIKRITPTGIETSDGELREFDVIVCATGFDTSYQYPFLVIGRNGTTLQSKWKPLPKTYLSLCVDEFPNLFFLAGPNAGVNAGSFLVVLERLIDYVVKVTLKMQRERLKSMEVKRAAVDDFDEYIEHHFKRTVLMEKCPSWYKMGKEDGRVVGLWPGSCLHLIRATENPRWEDFDYETLDANKTRNRFFWFGDGQTFNEKTMSGDRAWYLNDEEVDIPPVPEI